MRTGGRRRARRSSGSRETSNRKGRKDNRVPGYNNAWSKGDCLVIRVQRHKTRGESRIDRGEIVLARVQCGNGSPLPSPPPTPSLFSLYLSQYMSLSFFSSFLSYHRHAASLSPFRSILLPPAYPPDASSLLLFSFSSSSSPLFSLTGFFVLLHFLPFLLFCTKVFSFSLVVTIHSVQWTRSSARGGEIPGTRLAEYRHRPRETS